MEDKVKKIDSKEQSFVQALQALGNKVSQPKKDEKDTSINVGVLKEVTFAPHYYRRRLFEDPNETQKQYEDRVMLEWETTGGTFHF